MEALDFDPEKKKALRARIAREKKENKREPPQEESKEVHQDNFSSAFHQASQASQPKVTKESFKARNQFQPEEKGIKILLYLLYAIGGILLFLIGFSIAFLCFREASVIIY